MLDAEERPVAEAQVRIGPEDPLGEPRSAISDAGGRFEVRNLTPGSFRLRAERRGFTPVSRFDIELAPGKLAVDLGIVTLERGTSIAGRVSDPAGAPIEDAEVSYFSDGQEETASWEGEGFDRFQASTDAEGGFQFENLKRGARYTLMVRHPGRVPASLPGVAPPLPEPLEIVLREGRELRGRVVDPNGEPVPGAMVTATGEKSAGGGGSSQGQTDGLGEFRLGGLEPGPLDLAVRAEGYRPRHLPGVAIPDDRDPAYLEIALERGAALEGRVVDEHGEPVPGVEIQAQPEKPSMGHFVGNPFTRVTTDLDGRFRIAGIEPGRYRVSARSEDLREAEGTAEAGPGAAPLELVLQGGAEVSGWVSGEDGAPVEGAYILLQAVESGPTRSAAITARDGTFRVARVPAGVYEIKAGTGRDRVSQPIEIQVAGRPVQGIELRLERKALGTVTGRLLGLEPEELRGAKVEASGERYTFTSRVDAEGRYRITGLVPGDWTVSARAGGRLAQGKFHLEPDQAEVALDLDLSPGLTLAGTISVDGQPLAGAYVSLGPLDSSGSGGEGRTNWNGAFVVRGLRQGTYDLAIHGGGLGMSQRVELLADQEVGIAITTGIAAGRVLSPAGTPVAGATVALQGGDQARTFFGPSIRTRDDGTFEARVPASTYQVTVQADGLAPSQTQLIIPQGGEARFEATLQPAGPQ